MVICVIVVVVLYWKDLCFLFSLALNKCYGESRLIWWNIYFCFQGDVYPVEPFDGFTVPQVLDAHWGVLNDEDVSNLLFISQKDCCPFLLLAFMISGRLSFIVDALVTFFSWKFDLHLEQTLLPKDMLHFQLVWHLNCREMNGVLNYIEWLE